MTVNDAVLISLGVAEASDSYGFVGVVRVGDVEAYRTLEAFPAPTEAIRRIRELMGAVLGELVAGAEWRHMREEHGRPPTRGDYGISAFRSRGQVSPIDSAEH